MLFEFSLCAAELLFLLIQESNVSEVLGSFFANHAALKNELISLVLPKKMCVRKLQNPHLHS